MKIGTSLAGIWKRYGLDEFAAYEILRRCGFEYIDYDFFSMTDDSPYMTDKWRDRILETRERMERIGVHSLQAHAPSGNPNPLTPQVTEGIFTRTRRSIECCRELGVKYLVFHVGAYPGMSHGEFIEFNTGYIRGMCDLLEETGVELLVENIGTWQEPYYARNANEVLAVIDAADHPLVHACLDIGHLSVQEGNQYETIIALGKHLKALHVADNFGAFPVSNMPWRQDMHMPPLLGFVDFDDVMQGLKAVGFDGVFSLEPEWPRCFVREKKCEYSPDPKLVYMPLELTEEYYGWVYKVTQHILRQYDCLEQ